MCVTTIIKIKENLNLREQAMVRVGVPGRGWGKERGE